MGVHVGWVVFAGIERIEVIKEGNKGRALTPVGPAPTITKERASLISCFDSEGMLARSKQ
jgi:hypothetical protein